MGIPRSALQLSATIFFLLAGGLVQAQFNGLSANYDGSRVYFGSTLTLQGSDQPAHGKLFVAGRDGVHLFRSRPEALLPPSAIVCSLGPLFRYINIETSGDEKRMVALMGRDVKLGCSYPPLSSGSSLIASGAADRDMDALVRLSPDGRWRIAFSRSNDRASPLGVSIENPESGDTRSFGIPQPTPGDYLKEPETWVGPVLSNSGIGIVNRTRGAGLLLRTGAEPVEFPNPQARLLAISADGDQVVFAVGVQPTQLWIRHLNSGQDVLLDSVPVSPVNLRISEDGSRVLYSSGDVLKLHDGSGPRTILSGATLATLSGDGRVAFVATLDRRLLRIEIDAAQEDELIPSSPGMDLLREPQIAGLAMTLTGAGFSPDDRVEVNGRDVPVLSVTASQLKFVLPWDSPAESKVQVIAQRSPFEGPAMALLVENPLRIHAIVHQDWRGLVSNASPARPGEIIHVFASGVGAVSPEVDVGQPAPAEEPLARLAAPLTCHGYEVLYAGLAPLQRERVYQLDLRLGRASGYVNIQCSTAQLAQPFSFTLLVGP